MNEIKVSIIVPVYNVEKYLRQCLDSVINQTLKEIEIICVNDGSTDSSLLILEEYAQNDERIKIINKKNNGLGAARNTGIESANGEYIGFVDSDDWIDINMYEKLYNNAKYHCSDIVMCPIHVYDDITEELKQNYPYFTLECFDGYFDSHVFNHSETKDFLFCISVTAWNKIYKTEFLNKNNIKFPENLIFEDNPFFYETYLKANKVSLIRDFLYFYRINRGDSIISKADKRFFDLIKIHDLIKKIFINEQSFDEFRMELFNHTIVDILGRYMQVNEIYKKEFFELIKLYFENMSLKSDEIDNLNLYAGNHYQNVVNSDSYREFELLEKINQLEIAHNIELQHQKQIYEEKLKAQSEKYERQLQEITYSNSWKLTKPLRRVGTGLKKLKTAP